MANSFLSIFNKKPNKPFSRLYFLTFTIFLCTFFYFLGLWQNSPTTTSAAISGNNHHSTTIIRPDCPPANFTSTTTSSTTLDFSAHHNVPDPPETAERVTHAPVCDVALSEYTPCEDTQRSLKFPRENLIYRERHCPEKEEVLRCRIPAPYGYRVLPRWPESRDWAWYANVPHKELTIEKKNQNWVHFEGDRFRFPGGGTMFPRGAGAYIDDIGKLINLKDGSVRTALDTGCGVRSSWITRFSFSWTGFFYYFACMFSMSMNRVVHFPSVVSSTTFVEKWTMSMNVIGPSLFNQLRNFN